ncbi:SUKH-3 domain-containing protein [Streptacidiphilus sp. N1-3]|uniref:SUKH-3 domain-containing protein n=1 Tax=Streptacidiphilus alkalitolerans TaxID=3342712 RepID=A0ABV6WY05_9ACTN
MTDFSAEVHEELTAAGWAPGRTTDAEPWFEEYESRGLVAHQAARAFLGEFGGLRFSLSGPGVSRARESFELDPMLCIGEEDRFIEWGADLGRNFFPIGDLDGGRFFLGMDEDGEIYLIETWVASFGKMPQAMEGLVLGIRAEVVDDGYSADEKP